MIQFSMVALDATTQTLNEGLGGRVVARPRRDIYCALLGWKMQ
jgi:hypothetical protein